MAQKRISQKKILRELRRISESIPHDLLDSLLKKEAIAPTTTKLIEKAIALPDGEMGMTPQKRARFEHLLKSGIITQEIDVINPDTESAISKFIEAELALAVKMGRLPKDAPMPDFIRKKGIKYARKQKERLEKLFSAEEGIAPDAGRHGAEHAEADSARGPDDRVQSPEGGEVHG
jgi:hypothetical protein